MFLFYSFVFLFCFVFCKHFWLAEQIWLLKLIGQDASSDIFWFFLVLLL